MNLYSSTLYIYDRIVTVRTPPTLMYWRRLWRCHFSILNSSIYHTYSSCCSVPVVSCIIHIYIYTQESSFQVLCILQRAWVLSRLQTADYRLQYSSIPLCCSTANSQYCIDAYMHILYVLCMLFKCPVLYRIHLGQAEAAEPFPRRPRFLNLIHSAAHLM